MDKQYRRQVHTHWTKLDLLRKEHDAALAAVEKNRSEHDTLRAKQEVAWKALEDFHDREIERA